MLGKVYVFLIAIFCTQFARSQAVTSEQAAYFKSGTVLHTQFGRLNTRPASFDRKIRVYCATSAILTQNELTELTSKGVTFLGYIPQKTYVFSIPEKATLTGLIPHALGYWIPEPAQKIDPLLVDAANRPVHVDLGNGEFELLVAVYRDILVQDAALSFALRGWEVTGVNEAMHAAVVRIKEDELLSLAALPCVEFVMPGLAPPTLENEPGVTNHRSNLILGKLYNSLGLDGSGITIGLNDDGDIGPHIDFQGRADQSVVTVTSPINDHGDHVAGIMSGAGNKRPYAQGMAPGSLIRVNNYTSNINEGTGLFDFPNAYINHNVVITANSYGDGCNSGYTSFAQLMDQQINDHASLMHVFSAGNSGNLNCGYGAGSQWGNLTGGHKLAKNVLCVGNVAANDALSSSSSKGPTTDGRLKPEVVAVGSSVLSTTSYPSDHGYTFMSGTSMACPGVAGVLAQLYQGYARIQGSLPPSALIKGILMNTADDLGNPGPDFRFGYGRIHAGRAYATISENRYWSTNLSQGNTANLPLTIPANVKQVRVMLYWHDVPANVSAAPALVNDLDLVLIHPNLNTTLPWVLNSAPNATTLNAPATRNEDHLNNTEQITLDNPMAGNYTVRISGTTIPAGTQTCYITWEFIYDEVRVTYPIGGESFSPNEVFKIRWDSYGNATDSMQLSYSVNNGSSWINIVKLPSNVRSWDWSYPTNGQSQMKIKVARGMVSDESDSSFSILAVPSNLAADTVCQNYVHLRWDSVAGAQAYIVYQLGIKYMQPIDTVNTTQARIGGLSFSNAHWFAVKALGNNGSYSERSEAIEVDGTLIQCTQINDAAITAAGFPTNGPMPLCFDLSNVQPSFWVKNIGTEPVTGFTGYFITSQTAPLTDSYTGTLLPGDSVLFTFSTSFNFNNYPVDTAIFKIVATNDGTLGNDSLLVFPTYTQGATSFPMIEHFDSQTTCFNGTGCGISNCAFTGNFSNTHPQPGYVNYQIVNNTTGISGVGPVGDYNNPGAIGKYALFRAAGNCTQKKAVLTSGCIDLTAITDSVYLQFAYAQSTNSKLTVRVRTENQPIWQAIYQSNTASQQPWEVATLNLQAYTGERIQLHFESEATTTGFVALDAIQLRNYVHVWQSTSFPGGCADSAIQFNYSASMPVDSIRWNFGITSTPQTAVGAGPHTVQFSAGKPRVIVTGATPEGPVLYHQTLTITSPPIAEFVYTLNNWAFTANNLSTNATQYTWYFGDGDSALTTNATHNYTSNGQYIVRLVAQNACSTDDTSATIEITGLGVPGGATGTNLVIYPNPVTTHCFIKIHDGNGSPITYELYDITGKQILGNTDFPTGEKIISIPMIELANGVYLLHINYDDKRSTFKLIK